MKGTYTGCPVRITHLLPRGPKCLVRIPELSREATVRLRWFDLPPLKSVHLSRQTSVQKKKGDSNSQKNIHIIGNRKQAKNRR